MCRVSMGICARGKHETVWPSYPCKQEAAFRQGESGLAKDASMLSPTIWVGIYSGTSWLTQSHPLRVVGPARKHATGTRQKCAFRR